MAYRQVIVNAPDHGVPRFTTVHCASWIGNRFPMEDAAGRKTGEGAVVNATLMDNFGQRALLTVFVPDHLASNFEVDAGRVAKLFER